MSIWDKWADRVYSETDIGRSVAISVAGLVGLTIYLVGSDIAIAGFSAIIVFPVIRLIAASAHDKAAQLRRIKGKKDGLGKLYERLSPEEKNVVAVFVKVGGSVMTWGQMNKANTHFSAIESLLQRDLLHTSISADGLTETFVLDQDLFDFGQDADHDDF